MLAGTDSLRRKARLHGHIKWTLWALVLVLTVVSLSFGEIALQLGSFACFWVLLLAMIWTVVHIRAKRKWLEAQKIVRETFV